MVNHESYHGEYLDILVSHPEKVNLDKNSLVSVLREPEWYCPDNCHNISLCDIIYIYKDNCVPLELKRNDNKSDKAIEQLYHGKLYIEEILRLPTDYGLVAYYGTGKIKYDKIKL